MNPIELGKAIAEIGIPIITAVMLGLVVALVWYLIRRQAKREDKQDKERAIRQEKYDSDQKEERDYNRKIVTEELQKNIDLNVKGIILQKDMIKDFKDHNGHSEKFNKKVIKTLALQNETLILMCNKLNGGSPDIVIAKKRLNKDRRKDVKAVEVDRRK